MYLADRNVFGVDLNPIATELAEVSLWLNAIYGEPAEPGQPPRAARVPWFGYQLFCRQQPHRRAREVFAASLPEEGQQTRLVRRSPAPLFSPLPQAGNAQFAADEVYHFLLPDPGMANYTDKVAKQLYPADFERLKPGARPSTRRWKRTKSPACSSSATQGGGAVGRARQGPGPRPRRAPKTRWTSGPTRRASRPTPQAHRLAPRRKPSAAGLLNEDGDLRHALPPPEAGDGLLVRAVVLAHHRERQLPSREQWWMEVGAILEGNIVDLAPQTGLDLMHCPASA
jgi:hypothetical protein